MRLTNTSSRQAVARLGTVHVSRAIAAALLVLLACAALTACGGSTKTSASNASATTAGKTAATPPTTSSTSTTPASTAPTEPTPSTATRRHAAVVSFVNCMRRHGIHLPEPDANDKLDLHGVDVRSARYQTIGTKCLQRVRKNL